MPNPNLIMQLVQRTTPPTPQQTAAQNAAAQAAQAQDPSWLQTLRNGVNTGIDTVRGALGVGQQGPAGPTGYNAGAMLGAAMPMIRGTMGVPDLDDVAKLFSLVKKNAGQSQSTK